MEEFLADLLSSSQSVLMRDRQRHPVSVRVASEHISIAAAVKHKGRACFDEYLLDMALESALNNALRYARKSVTIWFEQQRTILDHAATTGLGLALCQVVMEVHGKGVVSLQNATPQGALFTLEIQVPG